MSVKSAELWVLWNVFLAMIPVLLAQMIVWLTSRRAKTVIGWITIPMLGLAWLAFLPNTCYLLTEWRHFLAELDGSDLYLQSQLNMDITLRLMIYSAFYFCYSGIGMMAFALAIRPLARIADRRGMNKWILGFPLFMMLSVGVYLGLVLRYNSWDLVSCPSKVIYSMIALAYRPLLFSLIICFGAFLWLAYFAIDVWIDGLLSRLKVISKH